MIPFDFLPAARNVARWFGQYGATLDDVSSYRNQIREVRSEMTAAARDGAAWRAAGLVPEADVLDRSLLQAEALIARMETRLMALGVQPDPAVASLVSDAARLLELYGDDLLEAGVL